MASTTFGLFVLGALTFRLRKQQSAEQREAIIVVGAILVAATFLVFGDAVLGQIAQKGFRDESRMAVYIITMRSILQLLTDTDTGPLLMFFRCFAINP
jgi:uncharacterized membrane protein